MFDWMRLSKEDYEMFGKCNPIEFTDIAYCFAAFETEESGLYGDSQDLVEIERIFFENEEFSEIDKLYNELWSKWTDWLMFALNSKRIKYANVTSIEDECEPLEEGVTDVHYGVCAINAKDFWAYLSKEVIRGNLDFDLKRLIEYMSGNSPAPSSRVAIEKIEVIKEVLPEGYHKKLADDRHADTKPLIEALKEFLKTDLSGDCTCSARMATDRIFEDIYLKNEDKMSRETGYGRCMLEKTVREVLKEIQEKTGIQRIVMGAPKKSFKKICIKHPRK